MKDNPVLLRELIVRSRSFRFPLIVFVFNGILAAAAMLNMFSVVAQIRISANIQYASVLKLYVFVATLEFLLLMFIMPALTSAGISGERERQTLDLLFTTQMTSWQIIMGKLISAFSQLLLLVVSSFPVLLLTFVYGGVDFADLALLLVCFVTVAMFTGGVGILSSSFMKRSNFSNVCTYGILLTVVVGTYMLNQFALHMSQLKINGLTPEPGEMLPKADSGAAVYLLLLNPVVTFSEIMENQVSGSESILSLGQFLGSRPENLVTEHWTLFSLAVQLVLAAIFVSAAVYFLNPAGRDKR